MAVLSEVLARMAHMIFLALICLAGLVVAAIFATQKTAAAKTASDQASALESDLLDARAAEAQLVELKMEMRGRDEQLAAEQRIAGEREGELDRLRKEHTQDRQVVLDQGNEIKRLKECIDRFQQKQEELAQSTLGAAESNQRIESTLLDWTRQIASPQGRGAF